MIGQILELIKITKCKSEFSQIALGKNKTPETFKAVYNHIKYFK